MFISIYVYTYYIYRFPLHLGISEKNLEELITASNLTVVEAQSVCF